MKKLIFILMVMLCFTNLYANEKEVVKKVVYNLTTGDIEKFEKYLISGVVANTTYYQNKLEDLDTRVIIHGNSYKFFMKDLNNTKYAKMSKLVAKKSELEKKLSSLSSQYNVSFYVCEVGVMKRKLNKKAFYPFVSMVKNASIGLIDAQNDGYAYIPIK